MNITVLRQSRTSKMAALVLALAVFQLYPLDICYGYGDQPDLDDIIQALRAITVPIVPPDNFEAWTAASPHGPPPDIPDVEKALIEPLQIWIVEPEAVHFVEAQGHETPLQQHILRLWGRPPPHI